MTLTSRTLALIVDVIIIISLVVAGLFFEKRGALLCALGLACLSVSWFRNPVSLKTGRLENASGPVDKHSRTIDFVLMSIGLILFLWGIYRAFT